MRLTNVARSDMPGPKVYLSWWGASDIAKQKGIYQYTISPYQAKAAPHMFRSYLFNGVRRLSVYALPIIIPTSIYYYVWQAAVKDYHWRNSKEGLLASGGGEE
ncbi:Ubiquinol-cytochrome-c reductase complex subunit 8 [Mycena indigotica]|uniref:Cytochrome b-c1 complex subunit 8 n=1 Tax=Mycena indigotica TaxID=2126181 RepID=A0A8H6WAY8_9AGAR|nr:Ubiquinol-cytochrome-c reductase complex subunit 8 [Mycena indigotica]KAF7309661.1 Ubiquinol-cytochrome-c reductase complex subunit 8 [Mycena indigotica]